MKHNFIKLVIILRDTLIIHTDKQCTYNHLSFTVCQLAEWLIIDIKYSRCIAKHLHVIDIISISLCELTLGILFVKIQRKSPTYVFRFRIKELLMRTNGNRK